MQFAIPVVLVGGIGLLSGIMLTIASKFFAVEEDESVAEIIAILPGTNCGGCGYAGCADYAAAMAADKSVPTNLCPPGGEKVAKALSEYLGVEYAGAQAKVAIVKCSGTKEKTGYAMEYQGYQNCSANKLFYRGRGSCAMACLGFGDCVKVCDYDAMHIENGIAVVNRDNCVGCGACAKVCPNNLIEIVPDNMRVVAGCSSFDDGDYTKSICSIGCIVCNKCVEACKFDAIHIIDNHAVIDYSKCTNCALCVKVCPTKLIHLHPRKKKPAKDRPAAKEKPVVQDKPAAEEQAASAGN